MLMFGLKEQKARWMNTERQRPHIPAVSAVDDLIRMNISGHPLLKSELTLVRTDSNHRSKWPKMNLHAQIRPWIKLTENGLYILLWM